MYSFLVGQRRRIGWGGNKFSELSSDLISKLSISQHCFVERTIEVVRSDDMLSDQVKKSLMLMLKLRDFQKYAF